MASTWSPTTLERTSTMHTRRMLEKAYLVVIKETPSRIPNSEKLLTSFVCGGVGSIATAGFLRFLVLAISKLRYRQLDHLRLYRSSSSLTHQKQTGGSKVLRKRNQIYRMEEVSCWRLVEILHPGRIRA